MVSDAEAIKERFDVDKDGKLDEYEMQPVRAFYCARNKPLSCK